MTDEARLLKLIAAVPAGDKLPLSRFAREMSATVSVVASIVERLIARGAVDPRSLRPPVAPPASARPAAAEPVKVSGQMLFERIRAAAWDRGMTMQQASTAIFGNKVRAYGVRDTKVVRGVTLTRVQAWLDKLDSSAELDRDQAAADAAPGTGAVPAPEGDAGTDGSVDRSVPAERAIKPTGMIPSVEMARRTAQRRQSGERASAARRPGETVAQAAAREARQESVADRFKRLAAEVDDECDDRDAGTLREARARRDERNCASPSALIRRATREWPDKARKVAALAAREGIQLGTAWQQVIDAGVAELAGGR